MAVDAMRTLDGKLLEVLLDGSAEPLLVAEIFDIVKRINAEQGTSVLLVEQNVRIALSITHHG